MAVHRHRVDHENYRFLTRRGKVVACAHLRQDGYWDWNVLTAVKWRHEVPYHRQAGTERTLAHVQAVIHGVVRVYVPL